MAEDPKDNQPLLTSSTAEQSPLFLEVVCKNSGKTRRFSVGTEARFAVGLINKNLREDNETHPDLIASHIEAIKQGQEPISFGPSSILVNYGPGWKLQTVLDSPGAGDKGRIAQAYDKVPVDDQNMKQEKAELGINGLYIGKIILAIVLIFVFGTIFTLLLDNLPELILYMNSSL